MNQKTKRESEAALLLCVLAFAFVAWRDHGARRAFAETPVEQVSVPREPYYVTGYEDDGQEGM